MANTISLFEFDSFDEQVYLGTVEIPSGFLVNTEGLGEKYGNGDGSQWKNVHDALNDLWEQWKKEVPEPEEFNEEFNEEFIAWLVGKGWKEVESEQMHIFE